MLHSNVLSLFIGGYLGPYGGNDFYLKNLPAIFFLDIVYGDQRTHNSKAEGLLLSL